MTLIIGFIVVMSALRVWCWHEFDRPSPSSETFYRVEVHDRDGLIVAIEPRMLSGRDIGASEDAAIRQAIQQLSGFIGLPK